MNKRAKRIVLIAALAVVVILCFSGVYRVGQGEQALVLTMGRVTDVKEPGLYFRIPFIQNVVSESVTRIHTVEYGFRTTRQGSASTASTYIGMDSESVMLTNDNSILSLEAIYQYTITDVKEYLFDVDDPENTLRLAFQAIVRRNIQNRSLDEALLAKEDIEREVLPDFQTLVDSYKMGVTINAVHIQNITVPDEVKASYEDVNNAKNENTARLDDSERYYNQVIPAARARANQTLKDAEAYKAEQIAAAQAEVAVFNAVYERYLLAPQITHASLVIDTLEDVLGGAGKLYIVDEGGSTLKLLELGGDGTIQEGGAR